MNMTGKFHLWYIKVKGKVDARTGHKAPGRSSSIALQHDWENLFQCGRECFTDFA
jgi:hypothetical protein